MKINILILLQLNKMYLNNIKKGKLISDKRKKRNKLLDEHAPVKFYYLN